MDLQVFNESFAVCSGITKPERESWCYLSIASRAPLEACSFIENMEYMRYCVALNSGVEACHNLPSLFLRGECVLRYSLASGDEVLCSDIALSDVSEWCLVWNALGSGDGSLCSGLGNRDRVRFCQAVVDSDVSMCLESKDWGMQGFCLAAVGLEERDSSVCGLAGMRSSRDRCLVLLSHWLGDASLCEGIEDRDYMKICNALSGVDLGGCGVVSRPSWVDLCKIAVAYSMVENDAGAEPWIWFMLESMVG